MNILSIEEEEFQKIGSWFIPGSDYGMEPLTKVNNCERNGYGATREQVEKRIERPVIAQQ